MHSGHFRPIYIRFVHSDGQIILILGTLPSKTDNALHLGRKFPTAQTNRSILGTYSLLIFVSALSCMHEINIKALQLAHLERAVQQYY